jgi:hypothetical protein
MGARWSRVGAQVSRERAREQAASAAELDEQIGDKCNKRAPNL